MALLVLTGLLWAPPVPVWGFKITYQLITREKEHSTFSLLAAFPCLTPFPPSWLYHCDILASDFSTKDTFRCLVMTMFHLRIHLRISTNPQMGQCFGSSRSLCVTWSFFPLPLTLILSGMQILLQYNLKLKTSSLRVGWIFCVSVNICGQAHFMEVQNQKALSPPVREKVMSGTLVSVIFRDKA